MKIFRFFNEHKYLIAYISIVLFELVVVNSQSDLVVGVANWENKAREIINLKIPKDNFYGPGSAIMLAPFIWNGPNYFTAIAFYTIVGFYFYYRIAEKIENIRFRIIALILPIFNVYLFWLFVSSQDTVFEFASFMAFIYFAIKGHWVKALPAGILVAETRSAYWSVILLGIITLFMIARKQKVKFDKRAFLFFPSLFLIMMFNLVNYGSISPALGGGMTAYFGFSKHHYLSLPKFDMDVFLSGPNGEFSKPQLQRELAKANSANEVDQIYYEFARESAFNNPKETILGLLQKFESHLINIQKVPQLPGKYVFDYETNSINIIEDRLNWNFVLGNLMYAMYRFTILFFGLIAIGITIGFNHTHKSRLAIGKLGSVAIFWLFSLVPAILYYSETRFKIIQEVSLIPLIVLIYSKLHEIRQKESFPHH